jgi:hypothetical protein
MSTAAVSSTPTSQQLQQYFQTRQQDLQHLGQALKSGNLAAAKTAFSNITSLGQNGPFASGNAFKISQRQQDFTAIGQALQSGDLGAARNAFEALKDTFHSTGANAGGPGGTLAQHAGGSGSGPEIIVTLTNSVLSAAGAGTGSASAGGPGGTLAQGGPGYSSSAGPEIILNLGNSGGSSAGPEQITINIANSSSGEQISLSVGHQGSPAQELQFNLPANSNEQIVLNLLNSPSSTGVGSSTSTTGNSSAASGGLSVTA